MKKRKICRVLAAVLCAVPMLCCVSPAMAQKHIGTLTALKAAISDTSLSSSFVQTGPITLDAALGAIGVSGSGSPTLTIFGGNYDLNGNSKSGMVVSATQNLTIQNVGSLNSDGSVNTSWHGFSGVDGAVVNTVGGLAIENSVFSANTASGKGGVAYLDVYTGATATISGSSFVNNTASTYGGAICDNFGKLKITDSVFKGNYTTGTGYGGAISVVGQYSISMGSSFINNGVDGTVTPKTNSGGAIYSSTSGAVSTIDDTLFQANAAKTSGGAINNDSGTIKITNSDFIGNYAITSGSGGAIITSYYGVLDINNETTFTGNGINPSGTVINSFGGAIYSNPQSSTTSIINHSNFIGNASKTHAGAIYNARGTFQIKNTEFLNNYTNNSGSSTFGGGAIYNASTGVLQISNGSLFSENGTDASDIVNTGYGGAIYNNGGTVTITDSYFTDNKTLYSGGAIYNASGTLNIKASAAGTTYFGRNIANSVSNAIHLVAGTLNFNTGVGGVIKSDDKITSAARDTNIININSNAVDAALTTGSVIFNNTVSDATVNLASGKLFLGEFGNTVTNNYLSNVALTQTGGLLSLANNNASDVISLSSFNANGGLLTFDTDLSTGATDSITATTASGTVNLLGINVIAEGATTNINLFDTASPTLAAGTTTTFTNNNKNEFTQDGAGGYNVVSTALGQSGLNEAVESTLTNRTFSATDNVTLVKALGAVATDNSVLTVFGNGHNITGTSLTTPAITTNSTQALNIIGVGSLNGDGTVATSWNGFSGVDGAAISNVGTLSILNSVFSANHSSNFGGFLYNNTGSAVNSTIYGSTFANNYSSNGGGAIYNNSGILTIVDTDFKSNYTVNSSKYGGAIFNEASGTLKIGSGTTFTHNGYNASNAVLTDWAGAIFNRTNSATTSTITGATFNDNAAINYAGAIDSNQGILIISDTDFSGNYTTSGTGIAGAIYNYTWGTLTIGDGSTFTSNGRDAAGTVKTNNGGAIYNNCSSAVAITIDDTTFTNNAALSNGGAIYNNAGKLVMTNTQLTGNYTTNSGSLGGAIYNIGTMQIGIDTNFTGNGIYDYGNTNVLKTTKGGAIYNISSTMATVSTIANAVFTKNAATDDGGAIYNSKGTLQITDSIFTRNYMTKTTTYQYGGGAIYNDTDGQLTIVGSKFDSNGFDLTNTIVTGYGGAIYNYIAAGSTSTSSIDSSLFKNNAVITNGGALYNFRGLITITDTDFSGNYTTVGTGRGGAIYLDANGLLSIGDFSTFTANGIDATGTVKTNNGGAIYSAATGTSTIANTVFSKNAVLSYGGAIYNAAGTLQISNTDFLGNYNYNSGNYGGAIYNTGILQVSSSSFVGNGFDSTGTLKTGRGAAIFNSTPSAVESTIDGSTFTGNGAAYRGGAICSPMGTLTITDSDFSGNYTTSSSSDVGFGGGAIHNYSLSATDYGTLHISNGSTFTGNGIDGTGAVSTYFGGAISSTTLLNVVSTVDNTTFTGNAAYGRGGAIFNMGGNLNITDTDFMSNYVYNSAFSNYGGGAIYNGLISGTQYGTLNISSGSRFIGNGIDGVGTVKTGRGGAIYNNGGIVNVTDTEFTGNKALNFGGAIFNETGTLNVKASAGGTTTFSGNIANSVSNAIHLLAGTLNLNAGAGGTIKFDDKITSSSINNVITVNDSAVDAGLTTGTIILNNSLSDSSLSLKAGTLTLGENGNVITNTYMSNVNLTMSGGTLDMQNNNASDTIALNNLTLTGGGLTIDANLATGTNDKITVAGTATGTLTINNINILGDAASASSTMTVVSGGTLTGLTLANYSVTSALYAYMFSPNATKGVYNVLRLALDGLNYAVARTDLDSRTFTANADVNLETSLGDMGRANSTLTIEGNDHNINGLNYRRVNVLYGQTLNINNVGSVDGSGNVLTSFNGFGSSGNGGVINNAGTLTITDSVFYNNAAFNQGGVVYNSTASDFGYTISGSTFAQNHSSCGGGAIFNSSGILNISDTDFVGNYDAMASYGGGAIYLGNQGILRTSNVTTFKGNGLNTIGTVCSDMGGAVYSNSFNTSTIDNTLFESNAALTKGGAIYNEPGTIQITDTDFIGNYNTNSASSDYGGGAIYNAAGGVLTISNGSTFTGNGVNGSSVVKTGWGGAIYNKGALTIKDSTFTNNKALAIGGAIYNYSGTLNVQASAGGATEFSGNIDSVASTARSNAIYLSGGSLNLNAGAGGTITFDDKIASGNINNVININDGAVAPGLTTGTVIFNNTVSDSSVYLKAGTLTLGEDNNAITNNYMSNANLTMSAGVLDMENNVAGDTVALNNLTVTGGGLTLDANLATGTYDKFTVAGTATGTLTINNLNILADATTASTTMALVSGSGDLTALVLPSMTIYNALYEYIFTQNSTNKGTYDVLRTALAGLNYAVKSTSTPRTFEASANTDAEYALGTMGGAGSTLTINGNGHSINGHNYAGVTVLSGQTLNINGVGSVDGSGNVLTSWNGFNSATTAAAINNAGNLSITNSVFSSNYASDSGGALYNNTAADVTTTISGSTFSANSAFFSGGAIYNASGILEIIDTDFIGNGTYKYGGAIYNDTYGTLKISSGSTFIRNGSALISNNGGAIYNCTLAATESTIDNARFEGNKAFYTGGTIYNSSGILTITDTDFVQNYTTSSGSSTDGGGSIYNTATLNISAGSTFVGNGIDGTSAVRTGYGGAIYNKGTVTIKDTTFTGNKALTAGGAIYNKSGTLNIQASNGGATEFSGNMANGVSNAIQLVAGTLNLNAGIGGIITFDDKIASSNINNKIMINDSAVAPLLSTGTVIFNNTVSDSSVYLNGGVLTLGENGNAITNTYMNNVNLNMSGGTLDMENNVAGDVINLNNLTVTGGTLTIDANLATGVNDNITIAGTATGALNLSHMTITDSIASSLTMTLVSATGGGDISGLSLVDFIAYTSLYRYDFTQSATLGIYDVVKTGAGGLNAAVAATGANRVFSASLDESLTGPLGTMGGADSTLTINGNGHNINGLSNAGVTVMSGQTLNINGVGSVDGSGNVLTSWNGQIGTTAGVIDNSGSLTITNSVFYNNSTDNGGGVLTSTSSDTPNDLTISGSVFDSNSSNNGAGALYINNTNTTGDNFAINISDSIFRSNESVNVSGGAIFNNSTNYADNLNSSFSITGSTFDLNYSNDSGGVIHNYSYNEGSNSTSAFSIIDTTFTNNYSINGYGGAVNNYAENYSEDFNSSLSISSGSSFGSNHAGSDGGAISNHFDGEAGSNSTITFEIIDTRFTGNYSESGNGGAISNYTETYADGLNASFTITSSIFDSNHSSYDGGAIYNYFSNGSTAKNAIATFEITGTEFKGNYSDGGNGGAIDNDVYNVDSDNLNSSFTISGSTFDSNHSSLDGGAINNYFSNYGASTNSTSTFAITGTEFKGNYSDGGNGGAIYNYYEDNGTGNTNTFTITNSSFTGNQANNGLGGAIYNDGGTLNITANGANTTFSGNTDSTGANDIYFENSTLNLNAGAGDKISFGGTIVSGDISNAININSSTVNPGLTSGTIIFNNIVSNATINLYNGTLALGEDNNTTTNTYLSNVNLTLAGGDLDMRNQNTSDVLEINNLTITPASTATISIDANLLTETYDKINLSGTATGVLQLANMNILADSELDNFLVQFITLESGASVSGLTLADYVAYTDDYEYDFSQSTTDGAYNVDRIDLHPTTGLNSAIASTAKNRSFNALADETVLYALGDMGGVNSTLTINANNHNINGVGYGGVNVLSGQKLIVIGANSWNGFVSTNGGAINNVGTTTIVDSVFENNKATGLGGAIYNAGTLNVQANIGNSTTFTGNTDSTGSNAIYMANGSALNLNAGATGSITFNDSIASASQNNTINVNDSVVSSSLTLGTVNFNNKISDAKVNVNAGAVNVGATTLSNAKFTMIGGTTTFNGTTFTNDSKIFLNNASAQTILSSATFDGSGYTGIDLVAKVASGALRVSDSTFSGYTTAAQGGVISNAGTTTIVNSSFSNNSSTAQGGAIYNAGTLNVVANGANTTFTNNKAAGSLNDIYLASASTLNLNAGNGGAVYINSGITSADTTAQINVNNTNSTHPTTGTVSLNSAITNSTVNMYSGSLYLANDGYLDNNNLTMNGGTLAMANNALGTMNLNNITMNGSSHLTMDADLAKGLSDRITATTATSINGGGIVLSGLNILSDTSSQANLAIADANISNYITMGANRASSAVANYNLSYNASSGNLSVTNSGFNPSVLATGSSALVGNYLSQTYTYNEAFANIDAIMAMPRYDRLLMQYGTKTADAAGNFVFSPTMLPEDQQGYWVKEFTTFENVPLHNGPNVSNVAYGMLVGKDSEIQYIGNGFSGYTSAYFGYMGSRQNFDNVSSVQNGGLIGLTGTAYKGDFFVALTANVGASNGNNYTPSGTDNFTSIMAGLAAKTGYNFNLIGDKLIVQPSLTVSYTFANTFDYTTAAGVNMTSDPLNAVQLIPGLKFISNLKNGWQPYIGLNMVWSFMDKSQFYANNIELPQASVDPYLEYGFGLQRKWGRFTGFGQAMARGGGRNGVALQFGFRWAIGK